MSVFSYLQKYLKEILLFLVFAITAFLMINYNFWLMGLIFLVIILIYVLSYKLEWGLYLMVLFYPFIDWQIYLTSEINLPPVDLLAIILAIAYVVSIIRNNKIFQTRFPFLIPFLLFFVVCAISLLSSYFVETNLKYLFRPILFVYLMYVVLPYNIVTSKKVLFRVLGIMVFWGVIISLMSLASLFLNYGESHTFLRAKPLTFGNFQPLGSNQNLLAELLITIIPLGLILIQRYKKYSNYFYFLIVGTALMVLTSLLTFSRASWLILCMQFFVLLFFILPVFYQKQLYLKKLRDFFVNYFWILFIMVIPFVIAMWQLMHSQIISSSNANRLFQWQIGWEMFKSQPLLGTGLGSFISILNRDPYYFYEFGMNLEAHGLILKLISEVGLLGLIAFTVFLLTILISSLKLLAKLKKESFKFFTLSCLLLSAFSIVIFQLFNTSYYTAKMWLPLGILIVGYKIYDLSRAK